MAVTRNPEAVALVKRLLRTVQSVFAGDERALKLGAEKVKEEFRKNRHVVGASPLSALLQHGRDCDRILREHVIQAELAPKSGNFRLNITEETYKFENDPFMQNVTDEMYKESMKKKRRKKCADVDDPSGKGAV